MQQTIGWDIGGAHVKAALVDSKGVIINVYLEACPLWKGVDYLHQAIGDILLTLPVFNYKHTMTMTGELVDLFDSRDEGVEQIIRSMQISIGQQELLIYIGQQGFINAELVKKQHYSLIASANWIASGSWVAKSAHNALFVDIGSTTTDILLCQNKKINVQGFSDYKRLQSQTLVYTGIIRTAVMALTRTAVFKGQSIGLMAEYFATMADVYRLTGELKEVHDKMDTADGKEKTQLASAKRLSRMIGYEFEETDLELWKQFAGTLKIQQKQQIKIACQRQLSRIALKENTYIVGAGIGHFLIKQIAIDLALPYKDFSELFITTITNSNISLTDCAPAVAVACLSLK